MARGLTGHIPSMRHHPFESNLLTKKRKLIISIEMLARQRPASSPSCCLGGWLGDSHQLPDAATTLLSHLTFEKAPNLQPGSLCRDPCPCFRTTRHKSNETLTSTHESRNEQPPVTRPWRRGEGGEEVISDCGCWHVVSCSAASRIPQAIAVILQPRLDRGPRRIPLLVCGLLQEDSGAEPCQR